VTKISVGICAYNEEGNLPHILSVMTQESLPDEIVVVASGCTDRTVDVAKSYSSVRVLEQERREGKASAINLFLAESVGDTSSWRARTRYRFREPYRSSSVRWATMRWGRQQAGRSR
jgi:glycosyltransferase involved in cell wall biosynthesis